MVGDGDGVRPLLACDHGEGVIFLTGVGFPDDIFVEPKANRPAYAIL